MECVPSMKFWKLSFVVMHFWFLKLNIAGSSVLFWKYSWCSLGVITYISHSEVLIAVSLYLVQGRALILNLRIECKTFRMYRMYRLILLVYKLFSLLWMMVLWNVKHRWRWVYLIRKRLKQLHRLHVSPRFRQTSNAVLKTLEKRSDGTRRTMCVDGMAYVCSWEYYGVFTEKVGYIASLMIFVPRIDYMHWLMNGVWCTWNCSLINCLHSISISHHDRTGQGRILHPDTLSLLVSYVEIDVVELYNSAL